MSSVKIDINGLKNKKEKLRKLVGNEGLRGELILIEYIIDDIEKNWTDPINKTFLDAIHERRRDLDSLIKEVNSYINILDFIVEKYENAISNNIIIAKNI